MPPSGRVAGIEDIEDVIHQIAEAEDSNYTLFTFVNELNRDIEKLQIRIGELKKDNDGRKENAERPIETSSTYEASLSSTPVEHQIMETDRMAEVQEATTIIMARTKKLVQTLPPQYLTDGALPIDDIAAENVECRLAGVERFVEDLLKVRRRVSIPFATGTLRSRRVIIVRAKKIRHGRRNALRFRRRCPSQRRRRTRTTMMASKRRFWTLRPQSLERHFVPASPDQHDQNHIRARAIAKHRELQVDGAFKTCIHRTTFITFSPACHTSRISTVSVRCSAGILSLSLISVLSRESSARTSRTSRCSSRRASALLYFSALRIRRS